MTPLEMRAEAGRVDLRRGDDRIAFARDGVLPVALAAWLADPRARLPHGWFSRDDGARLEMRAEDRRFDLHRAEVERLLRRLSEGDAGR
ncbi:hypothetical protein JQC91_15175 [Jannaschia sp. Os4]|uniref:hypothetical protein n=1 Tax=Jannaschia sp. Os4 TaxID=2807617 RepID=UPI001939EED4|nr:hypothetical protein [Jannaschia sp. Os4]MBM2577647.1 hypothetical protein [Jannaschia sp. Os4]